jgi:hypothetical protein
VNVRKLAQFVSKLRRIGNWMVGLTAYESIHDSRIQNAAGAGVRDLDDSGSC